MGLSVAGAKHGDAILIDEVIRREEAAEAESGGCRHPCCLPTAAAPDSAHKDEPDPRIRPIWGSFSSKCTLNP